MDKLESIKVIDFHIHIGLKEHWHEWVHTYQKAADSDYYRRYEEMIHPERFVRYLESHGVDKAVILPEISPITTGVVPNEYVFDFCQGHEMFIPFCTINPSLSKDPKQDLMKYIELGAKGIKLYPSYNHFYPNDINMYGLYEVAQEYNLPVLVHTGSSIFKGSKIKYADPLHLDDVASDFPDLALLLAHSGRGLWYSEAFFLSRLHPNLYLEISGLPPKNLMKYFPEMEKNIDKFVYGSDWPGIKSISSNIDAIKALPLHKESAAKVLRENAARILNT
jgi:predicted TIM-barrel fold metal-dependent hydrolase